jgi:hypothetical protein
MLSAESLEFSPIDPKPVPIIEVKEERQRQQQRDVTIFDPRKHLCYIPPEHIIMMKDIGYEKNVGVSPVAVSQPFSLFTKDAVEIMRAEILNPVVMNSCRFQSNIAGCQLRGYASKYAQLAQ